MSNNGLLRLEVGESVVYENEGYFIRQLNNLNSVVLIHSETNEIREVPMSEISVAKFDESKKTDDLQKISDSLWNKAMKRFEIIQPLLASGRTRQMVTERAKQAGVSTNTLYGWIKRYQETGKVTDLIPEKRADKGEARLSVEVEEIVKSVIKTEYKTQQKKSVAKVCREVERICREKKLKIPHCNTIRNWIKKENPKEMMAAREGQKKAAEKYSAIRGSFPGADWPLAYVQVDHTELDIQLCDDHWRKPVGRPWITVVFDVFSRMVLGFRVGFDAPSGLITGLAISHAILPKENWLAKYNINGDWPCWGIPDGLHMDNATEFRGKMIQRACDQYGINVDWRPVARPNYGAHIERYLGTLGEELKGVSGATFSGVKEKGDYDSEGNAVLTLSDLEEWLTVYIVGVYHNRVHSALGMSPLFKYKEGLLGDGENPGKGLPPKILDERRLRLDFLPYFQRTVQRTGVVIDEVVYFADVLRVWVNSVDPDNPRAKRKFIVRRDPRDISHIWFYDELTEEYYSIPYRNTAYPAVSIWELKAAQKRLKEQNQGKHDEHQLFEMLTRLREIEETAAMKTKSARRSQARKKHISMPPIQPDNRPVVIEGEYEEMKEVDKPKKTIRPFDDLDEML
ncbi:Mu transposase C-terminal domain-containing protein [Thiomicrorhabdus sp.]|uniref:Mu transposase C-terminal domain-containing protein n=1 Tax=Thiomicrorhabdus sp. TaxID=2039724 RepID=UPI0029C61A66|nr:Mu transposase C-terminal domain-containing protein [Thiomicrorhabdus sp.]